MLIRILFLTVISLQVSACIATPRFTKNISEDYEPPQKQAAVEQERVHPPLTEQAKEEIRKQVREELKLQQDAMKRDPGKAAVTLPPVRTSRNSPPPPSVVTPDNGI
jgi:hypothetical protein